MGVCTGQPAAVYALEGSVAYSGSVIQWLRDNLQMIGSAGESERVARSVPDNGGMVCTLCYVVGIHCRIVMLYPFFFF
jgi:glycerol kinase